MSTALDNKKIAKNTVLLYIRTIVVLFVALYTSRLVLKYLGADDLGIYNVVGGIVALMSFFQSALTKASSRFIAHEIGRRSDCCRLKSIFSTVMTIHVILVLLVVILGESLGLVVLNNFTTIPLERQYSATIVYHFSIVVMCVQILRIPYDSVLVAQEDMSAYAWLSIIETFLTLLFVVIMGRLDYDKLVCYSLLLLLSHAIICISTKVVVNKKYPVYSFSFVWTKDSKSLLSFSGWTLLGSSTNALTQQGGGLLFNNFVGLIANTALGFANQVNNALNRFVTSFSTAFNPQIIKLCAQEEYRDLYKLMNRASKFSFVLSYVMALPMVLNMDFLLELWLGDVPQYTVAFCRLILICSVIDATTGVYNTAITATGKVRDYQICISVSFLLDFVCIFILLLCNLQPQMVFASRILTRGFLNMIIGLYFCRSQLRFSIRHHIKAVMIPAALTIIVSIVPTFIITRATSGLVSLVLSMVCSLIINVLCALFIIMNEGERKAILIVLKQRIYGNRRSEI